MPMPLIEKIIDECTGKDVTIIPHQMGDLMADKRAVEILRKCKAGKLKILISTSGILLDKKKAKELIDIGVDIINISLDSLDKRLYERIRKISFEKVMKNVEELLSLKRPSTKVWVSAVDIFFNKKSRLKFIDYWKSRADHVQITPYAQYPKVHNWRLPRKKMRDTGFCQRLENDLVILSNGEVSKCCIDFEGLTSFGNTKNQTISEIWNGSPRRDFVENLKRAKRKAFFPCNICVI